MEETKQRKKIYIDRHICIPRKFLVGLENVLKKGDILKISDQTPELITNIIPSYIQISTLKRGEIHKSIFKITYSQKPSIGGTFFQEIEKQKHLKGISEDYNSLDKQLEEAEL